MKRYDGLGSLPMGAGPRSVAIGVFDGVHVGHQEVIRLATEAAARRGVRSMVITFTPNPLTVLHATLKTTQLTPPPERARLIERLGVDELLEIPFTIEFSQVPWERFCELLTGPSIQAVAIAVGRNFRFGHGGEGTTKMLRDYARARGIEVEVPGLVTSADGKPVSSTRIRRLIAQGDLAEVVPLLGRAHTLAGTVVRGDGRGTGLGVPTANVNVDDHMAVPCKGVYAAKVRVGEHWWPSAVNVGHAPTFRTGGELRLEAFLIGYDGPELYDQHVKLAFLSRLRQEQHFSGPEALVAQIHRDIDQARQLAESAADPL